MYVHNTSVFRQTYDSNKSVQVWKKVLIRDIVVQITFKTRKRNTGFCILKQGVPEGRSSEGYASFKQVKPWSGHVEFILIVNVVGLMTKRERERDRQTDRQRQVDRQTERERERTNERTNERMFFINEGNGISTILFLHPARGQKIKLKLK